MTVAELYSQLRFLTNQNSSTLSDADCARLINVRFFELVQDIVDVNENFFADYSVYDLVANQREYTLPDDLLKIIREEITYDGTTWYKGVELNERDWDQPIDNSNITNVDQYFSKSNPRYQVFDSSVFWYPIPTTSVTSGGKLYYVKRQTALATGGAESTVTIPKEFHYLIAEGASGDVFRRLGKSDRASKADDNYARGRSAMKTKVSGRNLDEDLGLRAMAQSYR